MSKKDKDEKVEQLKKEVYQIDALLRTGKSLHANKF